MHRLTLLLFATGLLAVPGTVLASTADSSGPPLDCETVTQAYAVNFPGVGGPYNFEVASKPIDLEDKAGNAVSQEGTPDGIHLRATSVTQGEVSSAVVTYGETLQDFLDNGEVIKVEGKTPLSVNVWFDKSGDKKYFQFDQNGVLTDLGGDVYGAFGQQAKPGTTTFDASTPFEPFWSSSAKTLADVAKELGPQTMIWFWVGVDLEQPGSGEATLVSMNGTPTCQVITPSPSPSGSPRPTPSTSPAPSPSAATGGTTSGAGGAVPGLPNTGAR
ncbi:MAG TPA: hypothetical protein VFD49_03255 [Candidatus Dormibacteraeota bacterium]|nr:hypothetical protein [Candidatus Dormibacteraeota bacterium]